MEKLGIYNFGMINPSWVKEQFNNIGYICRKSNEDEKVDLIWDCSNDQNIIIISQKCKEISLKE